MVNKNEVNKRDAICKNIIIAENSSTDQRMQAILKIALKDLATIPNLFEILEKNNDPQKQISFFDAILLKCNSASSLNPEILSLKANTLHNNALLNIGLNMNDPRPGVREEKINSALNLLDQANLLIELNKLDLKVTPSKTIQSVLKNFGKDKFDNSYKKSFEFAEKSLELREAALPANHSSIITALLTAAEIGKSINDNTIKVKSIEYAKLAYNMAITANNLEAAAAALQTQAFVFESFGDKELSEQLNAQATKLLLESIHDAPSEITSNQIIVHGSIDENRMLVKKAIQEAILDPIKGAAANGKWIEEIASINNGVSGYLDTFLEKKLGDLNNKENIETALELCFEAINLGIMLSDKPNPLCAAIFVQKYPQTISNVLEKHPEYFIDAYILKTSMLNASQYSNKLLGCEITENREYNSCFEEAILPFLAERKILGDYVFTPIKNIIKNGYWDNQIENKLLNLASGEFLNSQSLLSTLQFKGTYLGQNLVIVNDMINIVQVTAFKTLVSAIKEENSTNYAPITAFIKAYPKIVDRVIENHLDYLQKDKIITDLCYQTLDDLDNAGANPFSDDTNELFTTSQIMGGHATEDLLSTSQIMGDYDMPHVDISF